MGDWVRACSWLSALEPVQPRFSDLNKFSIGDAFTPRPRMSRARSRRETHPDRQAAFGARLRRNGGAMCTSNGADDGKTESVAVVVSRPTWVKPLKWLEEAFNIGRRN